LLCSKAGAGSLSLNGKPLLQKEAKAPPSPDRAARAHGPAPGNGSGKLPQPLPSLKLEIRDPDGKSLPPGGFGEIYVRGEQISGEYLDRSLIDGDGWFATKDAGRMGEEGYLDGRLDDVNVRGGENISPGEIKDVLRQHPNFANVAVLCLSDDQEASGWRR
jgi:acyl-CoA synthetase (AMP-forming)/AMP-acid ligase II